jgi:hypothetical protein
MPSGRQQSESGRFFRSILPPDAEADEFGSRREGRRETVTRVLGTICYLCLRYGQR